MKRTIAQSDFRRTSADTSHRTLNEIQNGPPKRKPVPYQPGLYGQKPKALTIGMRDLEEAKRQAAKYLPKNAKEMAPPLRGSAATEIQS